MTIRLDIVAGVPLRKGVPVLDSANEPVGITAEWSARVQVREHVTSPAVLHEWTTSGDDANAEIDEALALVVLTATKDETASFAATWPVLNPVWDLLLTDPNGEPHKIVTNAVAVVEPTITRSP